MATTAGPPSFAAAEEQHDDASLHEKESEQKDFPRSIADTLKGHNTHSTESVHIEEATPTNIVEIRASLKIWERSYAAQHGGAKPSRDAIREDSRIAKLYSVYHQLKSQGNDSQQEVQKGSKKRKVINKETAITTPSKRRTALSHVVNESKATVTVTATAASPIKEAKDAQTPGGRPRVQFVGPTPQKNGHFLGIFDFLSPSPSKQSAITESSSHGRLTGKELPTSTATVAMTSPQADRINPASATTPRPSHARTPTSRRSTLWHDVTTPSRLRLTRSECTPIKDEQGAPSALDETPAYLKSSYTGVPLNNMAEDKNDKAVITRMPWKRRTFGRSFSSLIQSLRDKDNDHLDEQMAIMDELMDDDLDADFAASSAPKLAPQQSSSTIDGSQVTLVSETRLERDASSAVTAPPAPFRRKRGAKRQTKRVTMRPVQPSLTRKSVHSAPHIESQNDDPPSPSKSLDTYGTDGDEKDEGDIDATVGATTTRKAKSTTEKNSTAIRGGRTKPNAVAHANFRRLKIKSKNQKGGKGRFKRR